MLLTSWKDELDCLVIGPPHNCSSGVQGIDNLVTRGISVGIKGSAKQEGSVLVNRSCDGTHGK